MATSPQTNDFAIAVMTRAPVAGATKTRLIPRLGAEGAADLHAHLVRRALKTARKSTNGPVDLWCAPSVDDPFLRSLASEFGVTPLTQPDGDLGARMNACFEERAPLLLMGADAPVIDATLLRACAACLREGDDAVFLPAEDGGYALVGLARPQPALFANMVWSVDTVMEETRRRMRALGLRWREPATVWDVDRPGDVDRLIASGLPPGWTPPLA
jgi:uncharacterized protein